MKFEKIIANISSDQVDRCKDILTRLTLDVCINPKNTDVGARLGGNTDNSVLLLTRNHILTDQYNTVATDGETFYWNPEFVISFEENIIGLRIIVLHLQYHINSDQITESKLSEIVADYLANNYAITEIAKQTIKVGRDLFKKHIGEYVTVEQLIELVNSNEEVKGFLAEPNSSEGVINFELSKLPEEKLSYVNTFDNHLNIKRIYDNEKLGSYILTSANPVDLESFEKEYPEYVERVNSILGVKGNSFVDVSVEEIKDILGTFTNRFEMYIASVMLGSKISFYCDRDKKVPLNTYKAISALEIDYFYIVLRTQVGLRRIMAYDIWQNKVASPAFDLMVTFIQRQEKHS